jgi:hypothetical protein
MKLNCSSCVALCALALTSLSTEAQQLDSVRLGTLAREVGSKVRVSTPSEGRVEGWLLEFNSETVRIDQSTGPRTVSFSSRDTLWVREPLGWTAAKFGAVAGLASAGALLLLLRSTCGPVGDDPCTGFARGAVLLSTAGVLVGFGSGLVAGQLIKHWVRKSP